MAAVAAVAVASGRLAYPVRRDASATGTEQAPQVVFWSRPAHDLRRSVLNELDAYAAVRSTAWQHDLRAELVPANTPFAAQRRLMCDARLLVGQHGAGIGSILWSSAPRRAAIELPPW